MVAFVTGHCHLNRHQALIDDAFTEQIRKKDGNEGPDGEPIIPPADPSCTLCQFDPSQTGKEETPLHLMTECVGLWQQRLKIFGTHNPKPPFRFQVYKIVAFLREAKIPTFPMQPYLEEQHPTAPTEIESTPNGNGPPNNPTTPNGIANPNNQIPNSPNTNTNTNPNLLFPEGDKWFHTYLYTSNLPLKPNKEKELLSKLHMRPLRY